MDCPQLVELIEEKKSRPHSKSRFSIIIGKRKSLILNDFNHFNCIAYANFIYHINSFNDFSKKVKSKTKPSLKGKSRLHVTYPHLGSRL